MNEVAKIKNGMIHVAIILLLSSFFLLFLYSIEGEEMGWLFTSNLWLTYTNIILSSLLLVLLSIKIAINKLKGAE